MKTETKAVSFDVHGTLIHTPRMASIYAQVLSRHGLVVEEHDVKALAPVVWEELSCSESPSRDRFSRDPRGALGFWTRYLERLCALIDSPNAPRPSPFAAAELFDRFAHAEAWEIYPDVLPCLKALAASGIERIVVSNFDERLGPLLEDLELAPYFAHVVTSSEVGVEKPHPEIFTEAAERLGLEPEQILHVGDSAKEDVEGARSVGMPALLIDRSEASSQSAGVVSDRIENRRDDRIESLSELSSRLVSAPPPPSPGP